MRKISYNKWEHLMMMLGLTNVVWFPPNEVLGEFLSYEIFIISKKKKHFKCLLILLIYPQILLEDQQ